LPPTFARGTPLNDILRLRGAWTFFHVNKPCIDFVDPSDFWKVSVSVGQVFTFGG
jgi:hypothetical protein